jgi:ubiquinone/menaquinone biosynthesis C-methylase UbiE
MPKLKTPKSEALSQNSKGYKEFIDALGSVEPEMHYFKQKVLKSYLKLSKHKEISVRWLDVGGGTGDPTISILEELDNTDNVSLEYTLIDYLEPILDIFMLKVNILNFKKLEIKTVLSIWEDYVSAAKYDIISFIHVFYYVSNLSESVSKAIIMLKNDGYIFICNLVTLPNGEDSHYNQIYKIIYGISTVNIYEIANEFKKQGAEVDKIVVKTKVLDLFEIKRKNQSKYRRIISFITDRKFSKSDEKIVLSVANNGKLIFPLGFTTVKKPPAFIV